MDREEWAFVIREAKPARGPQSRAVSAYTAQVYRKFLKQPTILPGTDPG